MSVFLICFVMMGPLDLGMLAGQSRPSLELAGLPCNSARIAHQLPAPGQTLCALDRNGEVKSGCSLSLGPAAPAHSGLATLKGVQPPCWMWLVSGLGVKEGSPASSHLLYVPWLPAQGRDGPCHVSTLKHHRIPSMGLHLDPCLEQRKQQSLCEGGRGSLELEK